MVYLSSKRTIKERAPNKQNKIKTKQNKTYSLLLDVVFIILLISTIISGLFAIYAKRNPNKIEWLFKYGNIIYTQNTTKWESAHIKSDIDYKEEDIETLMNGISKIPNAVIQLFYADGGYYYFTSTKKLNELHKNINPSGYRYSASFVANIAKDNPCMMFLSTDQGTLDEDVIHEFGHYIDYKTSISKTKVWEEEYKKYFKDFELNEYYDSPNEFFAEVYHMYRMDPKKVYEISPSIYKYLYACDVFMEHSYLKQKSEEK